MNKAQLERYAKKLLLQIDLKNQQNMAMRIYKELSSQSKGMEIVKNSS